MKSMISSLLRMTLVDPRAAATVLIELNFGKQALWALFWLVVIISVISAWINAQIIPPVTLPDGSPADVPSPFAFAIILVLALLAIVTAGFYVGRAFGGVARFEDILVLVTWVQMVLLVLQFAQTLSLLILPPLAGLIGLAGPILLLWLLTNFFATAHGFLSRGMVFVVMIGCSFVLGIVAGILLAVLGIDLALAM